MNATINSLFSLQMPWWEFVLRAVVVYVLVLLMVRLSGKRTVGQLTPFDLLVVVLLGTAVQNALIGVDTSLLGGVLLAATLLLLNWLLARISARWWPVERLLEGRPVILVRRGRLLHQQLARQSISLHDFASARRLAGYGCVAQIELAVLEPSGEISFVPARQSRRQERGQPGTSTHNNDQRTGPAGFNRDEAADPEQPGSS